MKWLELIKVKAARFPKEAAAYRLLAFAKDIEDSPGLSAADVYAHASVNGDFAISLLWDTDPPQPTGSLMGLNLREALKKYGLVDHSVWLYGSERFSSGIDSEALNERLIDSVNSGMEGSCKGI